MPNLQILKFVAETTMDFLTGLLVAAIGGMFGIVAAILTLRAEREKIRTEYAAEISVEIALKKFLSLNDLPYRSFAMIRHHIGGFEANELRQLLVRAGAVRFMASDQTELWALRERVPNEFKYSKWKLDTAPLV